VRALIFVIIDKYRARANLSPGAGTVLPVRRPAPRVLPGYSTGTARLPGYCRYGARAAHAVHEPPGPREDACAQRFPAKYRGGRDACTM
jgi:hypothetical protein